MQDESKAFYFIHSKQHFEPVLCGNPRLGADSRLFPREGLSGLRYDSRGKEEGGRGPPGRGDQWLPPALSLCSQPTSIKVADLPSWGAVSRAQTELTTQALGVGFWWENYEIQGPRIGALG